MTRPSTTLTGLVWVVSCSLAVTPAHGTPVQAEASKQPSSVQLLKQAQQQIAEGEFDEARATLVQARKSTREPALLGQIEFHLSLVWHTLEEHKRARGAMLRALRQAPELEPDPERFKPSFVTLFFSVRQELKGTLIVTCNLPDAQVTIDGRAAGRVPYRGAVAVGAHTIKVRAAHGPSRTERVTVALGQQTRLHLKLTVDRLRDPKPAVARTGRLFWTWIAAAGAAVATSAAIGFGVAASSSQSDGESLREQRPFDMNEYSSVVDSLDRHRRATNISWGVAGVLAATAAALFFWERRERPSKRSARGPTIIVDGPSRVGLSLAF